MQKRTFGNNSSMTQMTSLHEERLDRAASMLKSTGATRVLDLGCGSGSLIHRLLADPHFTHIVGLEQSGQSLQQARQILGNHLRNAPHRLQLIRGSYTQANPALSGFEAAAMIETIEHVNPEQLSQVERTVFGEYRPGFLLMTTPNKEYNPLYDLAPGEFREPDHKFEWDRQRFQKWARGVAQRNGYTVTFGGIGEYAAGLGQPTQTALFSLADAQKLIGDDARR
ncbi:methyltransferase [Marinobacter sp. CHS3-4]|uniref:methyltransferase n=1 Tax=Marinobacter sp. CHS3-4 TaxID=3045174 RepID=UPI0024B5C6A9|nr:methyltransferase [Marinobacter sp. CHS3-4]MDI9244290.1 methyltransferase domain-containing protein [Marinobacter sp. CHS3-4]